MAADLKAQEERGMAKYATDEPSENWSPEFWVKFKHWEAELEAYQCQETAEVTARHVPAGGAR